MVGPEEYLSKSEQVRKERAERNARVVAVLLLLIPVILGLVINIIVFFLTFPVALAVLGAFRERVAWPHLYAICTGGLVASPLLGWALIPGPSLQGFLILCAVSLIAFAGLHFGQRFVGNLDYRPEAAKQWDRDRAKDEEKRRRERASAESDSQGRSGAAGDEAARTEQPASTGSGGTGTKPPIFATTTKTETPAGTEYKVTWTDYARLAFWDRYHQLFILPGLTLLTAIYAFALMYHPSSGPLTALAWTLGVLSVGLWTWKFIHERRRYRTRTLIIRPDGTIEIPIPPSAEANYETDGLPVVVSNGVGRLTSVEYTKTAEWSWIMPQCVYSAEHWYDVHLFFGEEWRVSVSRNLGSRDHAHQVTGHLNRLKAALTRPKASAGPTKPEVLD